MSKLRINPYTGLPPYAKTTVKVIAIKGNLPRYCIEDGDGRRISKVLTHSQLNIATQHAINVAKNTTNGKISEVTQALINHAHKFAQTKT